MLYRTLIKIILTFTTCIGLVNCTSENAETLFPTNDTEARVLYDQSLRAIIENKCISCHIYHLEGTNRYDSFEKTKSSISLMLSRINKSDNTVMPPPDSDILTAEEKQVFDNFLTILNGPTTSEPNRIRLQWTAYKYPNFNERAGVSGTFDDFNFTLNEGFENPIDILKDAEITINTSSVNVSNEIVRTTNVGLFFGAFTSTIKGKVISYLGNTVVIAFTMNSITQNIELSSSFSEDGKLLTLKGTIPDLAFFEWQNGHDTLEKVCAGHHQNKLWPDVALEATIQLKAN